jgi:hypothetical protein
MNPPMKTTSKKFGVAIDMIKDALQYAEEKDE